MSGHPPNTRTRHGCGLATCARVNTMTHIGLGLILGVNVLCIISVVWAQQPSPWMVENGATKLHEVVYSPRGATHVMSILEKGKGDPNVRDKHRRTPLHHAAKAGNVEPISLLVGAGGKVNARDDFGFTPLHYAASEGYPEAVSLLLEFGADPFATIPYEQSHYPLKTPLGMAKVGKDTTEDSVLPFYEVIKILNSIQKTIEKRYGYKR